MSSRRTGNSVSAPETITTYADLIRKAENRASNTSPAVADLLSYMTTGFITVSNDHIFLYGDFDASRDVIGVEAEIADIRATLRREAEAEAERKRADHMNTLLANEQYIPFEPDEDEPLTSADFSALAEDLSDTLVDDGRTPDEDEDEPQDQLVSGPEPVEVQRRRWQALRVQAAAKDAAELHPAPVGVPDNDRVVELEKERKELLGLLWDRRMRVDYVGIDPGKLRDIEKEIGGELEQPLQMQMSQEQRVSWFNDRRGAEMLAASIAKITFFDGPEDEDIMEHPTKGTPLILEVAGWQAQSAREFGDKLPNSELIRLMSAVEEVSYAAVLVDLSTDAGFPGGRSESEGE